MQSNDAGAYDHALPVRVYWQIVTFGLNARLDLSREATTESLCTLDA